MAAFSLGKQSDRPAFINAFAGTDRFIADYLIDEVLNRQPAEIKSFLLHTSILQRLNGNLCDAVMLRPGCQAILEELEQANLFVISMDNQRQWFRYHTLFGELLRQRLGIIEEVQTIYDLHQRALHWYQKQGMVPEAVSHALLSGDIHRAASLVEKYALPLIVHGGPGLVQRWLEAFPKDVIMTNSRLATAYAWSTFVTHPDGKELVAPILRAAEESLAEEKARITSDHSGKEGVSTLQAYMEALHAFLAFELDGDVSTAIRLAKNALEHVPKTDDALQAMLFFLLGECCLYEGDMITAFEELTSAQRISEIHHNPYMTLMGLFLRTTIAVRRGQLRASSAECRQALLLKPGETEKMLKFVPSIGPVYSLYGSILLEWNELEKAEPLINKGVELSRLSETLGVLVECLAWAARLYEARGDEPALLALVKEIDENYSFFSPQFSSYLGRFWLRKAEFDHAYLAKAVRWKNEYQVSLRDESQLPGALPLHAWRDAQRLTLARLIITCQRLQPSSQHMKDLLSLEDFLEKQQALAEKTGWTERLVEILILKSLALKTMDNSRQALAALEHALALAEPEGYLRIFLDEGHPIAWLLYKALEGKIHPEYVGKILAAFPENVQTLPMSVHREKRDFLVVEPLSRREIEVLRLISEGLTNQEIAVKLVLSPGTVKAHTNSIFGKLNVHSRTQAVSAARALGIL